MLFEVGDAQDMAEFARYEEAIDDFITDKSITALCEYNMQVITKDQLRSPHESVEGGLAWFQEVAVERLT